MRDKVCKGMGQRRCLIDRRDELEKHWYYEPNKYSKESNSKAWDSGEIVKSYLELMTVVVTLVCRS